jgi:hypothetical protein
VFQRALSIASAQLQYMLVGLWELASGDKLY